jgi:peptidyl-prolyl cis-trans isomerase B (cyclophilin B)
MKTFPFLLALLLSSGCAGVTVKTAATAPPARENPPTGIDAALWKTVDALVAKLGSDDWAVRDAAQKEIEALPDPGTALAAVKASVERRSADAEIKHRGELAIKALDVRWALEWLAQHQDKPEIDDTALPLVSITTDRGVILIELFEDDAPNTVSNFINLTEKGFYDGLTFHRVEANFMIQGGDPQGKGFGGPGYCIKDEFSNKRLHDGPGTLSMANRGPSTGGSQFFITHVATHHLDGKHAVFGRVIKGQDVVDAIRKGDKMTKVMVTRKKSHEYKPEVIK